MAFPRKLLYDGEEIVIDTRPHWWFLSGPTAGLAVAIVVLIVLLATGVTQWVQVVWAILTLVALVWFLGRYARWSTTNFVLTTDRLIYRSGVMAKRGVEMPLERINTVFFRQSVWERLLRAGDLTIESGGETGRETFSDIPKPSIIQNEIYRQIETNSSRRAGGGAAAPSQSVPEQLEKLDDLRRRGVLTQAEFDAKKAELLDRM